MERTKYQVGRLNIKTFTARTMAQALAVVRQELGSDAVVLHTRTYRRGGLMGIGSRAVAEVTAANGRELGRARRQTRHRNAQPRRDRPSSASTTPQVSHTGATGDLIRRTYAAAKAELEKSSSPSPPPASPPESGAEPPRLAMIRPTGGDSDQLAQEMRSVKRMVRQMMRQQARRGDAGRERDIPDTLFDQYLALLEQEVTEELAEEVMQQVRISLPHEQIHDQRACREAALKAVAALLPTDSATKPLESSGGKRPRTIALVGPTGVGKTTTIAKLAATLKLKQQRQVALITLDTYRIAAVDQLRTYAGIIGLPLHVVISPEQLRLAIESCSDYDVVLIDTAGRCQRDNQNLEVLAELMELAHPDEVHLVLSSTSTQSVLMDVIDRFSKIRTDWIIFTKLDEAVTFGVLLNVLRKVNKRLSYITTGQEVPHQIEPGSPDRVAALVLGEAQARQ